MPLITRSSNDILSSVLGSLRNTGITYTHKSSKAYNIASALSKELDLAYGFFNSNYDSVYLRNASKPFLDALGELFGVRRRKISKCYTTQSESNLIFYVEDGTFSGINSGSDISIPIGTIIETVPIVTGQSSIQYVLTSAVTLLTDNSSQAVNAEALIEGITSRVGPRTLISHNFTSYTDVANNTLKVINQYGIVNGEEDESDASYKFRISQAATALQTGNSSSIRFATYSVPGITDTKIIPYFEGIGTVGVFVVGQGNTISPLLVSSAQDAIEPYQSLGTLVNVYSPEQVGISFTTKVITASPLTINAQNELTQKLVSVARDFIIGLAIGDALNLDQLEGLLIRSDNRILRLGTVLGTPFDSLGIWRTTAVGNNLDRVRADALNLNTVSCERHEIFIPELSLTNPLGFTY